MSGRSDHADASALGWKHDWPHARRRLAAWWRREGLALCLTAPRERVVEAIPAPDLPATWAERWSDPTYRRRLAEHGMSRRWFAGEAFPYFDTQIGPGSLGMMLGAAPSFAPDTVWYEPVIADPESFPDPVFDEKNPWWRAHERVVAEGVAHAAGRYLVGMPDLIENLDTLAALRGSETVLYDLIERPAWVERMLWGINDAYFAAFDRLRDHIRDEAGGNAFSAFDLWGPGRTAKVQCDIGCMISPKMFRRFVVPPLAAQCAGLDWAMFHVDGPDALKHVEALLEIEALDALQWTPGAGQPGGGAPCWYDLYRRIKSAGKAVQAIGVRPEEVVPLLDAVGPAGLFIRTAAESEDAAARLLADVEPYRM